MRKIIFLLLVGRFEVILLQRKLPTCRHSVVVTPNPSKIVLRIRIPLPAPAQERHFPNVAQRIANGSLICASRQAKTTGLLMKGLELASQLIYQV